MGADHNLLGNGLANTLVGNSGSNKIFGGAGSDIIDGSLGVDSAVYEGVRTDYTFTRQPDGSLSVTGRSFTDSLTSIEMFQFADGTFSFAEATNHAPALTGGKMILTAGKEDVAYTVNAASLLAGFSDADNNSFSVFDLKADHGSIKANSDGTFTITPSANYHGAIKLTYGVSDGIAVTQATQSLNLSAVNDAPVLSKATSDQRVAEDSTWLFKLLSGMFSDVDDANLNVSATLASGSGLPLWLKFGASTQTFSGNPPADWHGGLDIKVTAGDVGKLTAADAFKLTVTPVNDAPVIDFNKGEPKVALTVAENKRAVTKLKAADTDDDDVSWFLAGKDAGLFAISTVGRLSFKAAPDYEAPKDAGKNNTCDVIVKVFDGKLSDSQALAIMVADVKGKTLAGTTKADTLKGTLEADLLFGGKDADKLYGDDGNDRFVFKALSDSTADKTGQDTIYDFSKGDRFDLSTIDANSQKGGNQPFSFIGTDPFHRKAGELRFKKGKSDTYVYADVHGDKKADFALYLDDAIKLVKAGFLL